MAGPARVVVLKDTDHFLAGWEQEGAELLAKFLDGLGLGQPFSWAGENASPV